ncbi:hypothetical protein ALI144C_27515 [Actinosynnema sp. ALI-1.44]|nr:hypothetical protein ALI144C_27515 [Actinosynnema sp. ALI-1.44]
MGEGLAEVDDLAHHEGVIGPQDGEHEILLGPRFLARLFAPMTEPARHVLTHIGTPRKARCGARCRTGLGEVPAHPDDSPDWLGCTPTTSGGREQTKAIRDWARQNGYDLSTADASPAR